MGFSYGSTVILLWQNTYLEYSHQIHFITGNFKINTTKCSIWKDKARILISYYFLLFSVSPFMFKLLKTHMLRNLAIHLIQWSALSGSWYMRVNKRQSYFCCPVDRYDELEAPKDVWAAELSYWFSRRGVYEVVLKNSHWAHLSHLASSV